MIKIIFCEEGQPISDFKAYETIDSIIENYKNHPQDMSIKTSNELYLLIFGLRILEGKISMDELEFYFEDEKLEFNMYDGILEPKEKHHNTEFLFAEVTEKAVKTGYANWKRDRRKEAT